MHLRNGKSYAINDAKIIDIIPHIMEPTGDYGSLKPDHIQKGTRTTRFIWNMGRLEPGEERVLSYKARARLALAGEITLPVAVVQYLDDKGSINTDRSARLVLKQKREEEEEKLPVTY